MARFLPDPSAHGQTLAAPPKRFLPLFDADGGQIARPDLYLLACMAAEDKAPRREEQVIRIHGAMLTGDNGDPRRGKFETFIAESANGAWRLR